jgi:pyridoxine 5-phosphate synthase
MIRLGVNIDHVATIRQARRGHEPDPLAAAFLAVLGGADGITVHLREDRRHVQERDLRLLRQTVTNRLNLELACADEVLTLACQVLPDEATLVPERREELTTEGGLDVIANEAKAAAAVERLRSAGIETSLFIDPVPAQIEASRRLGVHAVEIQTATYSEADTPADRAQQLEILARACRHARQLGLHVHVGHGLNYHNVQAVAALPEVEEMNIGHSIVSRAVLVGMERAVRDMKEAMRQGRGR